MSAGSESLYLIDAHSLIFQVFHALPEMTSPSGLPTNAVFGFTKDLIYLRDERKPTYLLCLFDVPGRTFRDAIDPEYKAHRAPMPDDLQLQIPLIHQVLEAMRIPVLGVGGYEADDLIATLAASGAKRGLDVFICSSDKDCRQLLSDRVKIFNLRKQEVYDAAGLFNDWGVTPEQVVDFQTLVGDSVDNVKGVPGIGPKTAGKLLQDFHTLDNLLAHADEIPGKKQEAIKASAAIIANSRQLVRLKTDVPVDEDWENWRLREWDAPKLVELFRSLGFHRFTDLAKASMDKQRAVSGGPSAGGRRESQTSGSTPKERITSQPLFATAQEEHEGGTLVVARTVRQTSAAVVRDDGTHVQGNLFADTVDGVVPKPSLAWQATYHLVNTSEAFAKFLSALAKQPMFAFDLETTSLEARRADLVGLAFCWRDAQAWYLPVRGPCGEPLLDRGETLGALKPILENPQIGKVNQNIKYDLEILKGHGIEVAGVVGDPMVADYLLHAGERTHNMEVLADKHLHHQVIPISALIGKGKSQKRMDEVPCAQVAEYAGEDADVAWRLQAKLEPVLQELEFKKLYDELEIPLIGVLADMEFTGIRLDLPLLRRMSDDMAGMLVALERDIYDLAGREFNIASVKQLREVLFAEKGYKSGKKTAIMGHASTDQETLEKLARAGEPLPQKLLEQRKIAKLKSTYVDALPALVNEQTGRVHASFNQTVTSTGRLSSSDPNLQNIPIRTEQGGQIRQAFVPEAGWELLAADYSQIELRLLAHYCGDEALQRAFAEDRDIHAQVAGQVFGVAEKDITADMRRMAKTINFGVIYGISPFGLAARLEISKEEGASFIDAYFARYPRVLAYQEHLLEECRRQGCVRTILGRRRAIAGIRPRTSYKARNQPEREAVNMQIQGSAADLIKVAMVNIHRRLKKEKRRGRLLLQIHDELVFEMPPEEREAMVRLVHDEMTTALGPQLRVPLKVDIGVGPNWLDVA
jgi:DNA polymerase-1